MKPAPHAPESEVEQLRREIEALRARVRELEAGQASEASATASSALVEADRQLAARLFEGLLQLPLVLYRVGPDGRFREIIGRAIERIGLVDPEQLVGRDVLDIFPEASTVVHESLSGKAVWSETSGSFQGHQWAALSFIRPVDGEEGGTIGISLDITDWREMGNQIAASERLFRSLAETVAVAISRNDTQGFIVYANEPMGSLLGVPPAELIGRNSLEFVVEADRARVTDEWFANQAAGDHYAGVFRIHGADGSTPWVLSRSVPELDEAGHITGFIASLVDITERKQVEEDLSRRVAERTAQLVRANKELEAFCYSVSHDLRAPLRGIDGFCRLLAEELGESLEDTARDYLARVLAATAKMDRLIDDFLTLSRASLAEVTRSRVSLSEIARGVAEDLRQRAPGRTVRFVIEPGLHVQGDPVLLRDALENLLGNAFKFTARTADACIEFFRTHTKGESVFVVRDNGAGFDMQQASKLFTAFHRLHDERDFEGTGVGLATVERIIQRHGGRVWAEARPGRGASFMFTVPAA
jgi:PAS domain S-box-containing protein